MKTIDIKKLDRDRAIVRLTTTSIGEQLNNKATLLIETPPTRFPSEAITTIVLAVTGGFQPFVVWERCRDFAEVASPAAKQEERIVDYCINGHYFTGLGVALDHFNQRAIREIERRKNYGVETISDEYREYQEFLRAKESA